MRVLVTGGAGYVGSRVVRHMLSSLPMSRLTVLDRLDHGPESIAGILDHPSLDLHAADINSHGLDLASFDVCVHMAAIVGDNACRANRKDAKRSNYTGTLRLLDDFKPGIGRRFVFLSTCSNYGITNHLADETSALNPLSLYAETKVEAEKAVLEAGGAVLRMATVCGLSSRMRWDLLVNEMAKAGATGQQIEIYNPDAWRPYTHIRDAAQAIFLAATDPVARGVFNIASENLTKQDLVKQARAIWPDLDCRMTVKGWDDRDYAVSAEKAQTWFGFQPAYSVSDALRSVGRYAELLQAGGRETLDRTGRDLATLSGADV